MSFPDIHGTGRLVTQPNMGVASTGDEWSNALVVFTTHRPTDTGGWEETGSMAATVVGYGEVARQLAAHTKGDVVTITGRINQLIVWNEQPRVSITLDAIEAVRAKGSRKGSAVGAMR